MKKIVKLLTTTLSIAVAVCIFSILACAQENSNDVYYARDTVDGNVAYVYDRLSEELLKFSPSQEISLDDSKNITEQELALGVKLFLSDHPECFFVNGGYGYSTFEDGTVVSVSPNFDVSVSDIPYMRAQLDAVVEQILEAMPDGDNYAKALYLHDAVASHTEYVETGLHQSAYGALVSGKAICAGYASAYQLLLQRAGICAWTVTGMSIDPSDGQPEAHAWNMVMIEDGVCVYSDVTWDDQGEKLYRAYFNRTLEQMKSTHAEDASIFTLPSCSHSGYGYFEKNEKIFMPDGTPEQLAKFFVTAEDGNKVAKFLYTGSDIKTWLDQNKSELYELLGGTGGFSYKTSTIGGEVQLIFTGDFSELGDGEGEQTPDTDPEIPEFETDIEVEKPTEPIVDIKPIVPEEEEGNIAFPTENSPSDKNEKPDDDDREATKKSKSSVAIGGCSLAVITPSIFAVVAAGAALVLTNKKYKK
ncbi:MAG: hypothetical protein E7667_06175 [Ruminococcaceae bacterium]|nr:hypothetical protein [Oscillospiraceae bacterium]